MTTKRYFGLFQDFRNKGGDASSAYIFFKGRDGHLHRFQCDKEPTARGIVDMFGGSLQQAIVAAQGKDFEYTVDAGRVTSLFPYIEETR